MAYAWQLLNVFKTIKDNIWQKDDVIIDSMNMRMNYQATVSFLLTCSCLVTFNNWFGGEKPIECLSNSKPELDFLEDFCLIEPKRISVRPEDWDEKELNRTREGDFAWRDHGCTKQKNEEFYEDENCTDLRVHDIFYYEWTAMFFIAQALCFYATRFIWKRWENGTMKQMKDSISRKELSEDDQARIAAEILKERQDKNFNNVYSTGYCFAEFFCYLNIVCQWIITTRFLGEIKENWITTGFDELNFYTLGFHVLKKIQTNPWLPLKLMFPRQSYCRFQMYGSGGRMNTYQFLCLLSLNIIHDKVSHTNSRITILNNN